jgi:hypothetical protein
MIPLRPYLCGGGAAGALIGGAVAAFLSIMALGSETTLPQDIRAVELPPAGTLKVGVAGRSAPAASPAGGAATAPASAPLAPALGHPEAPAHHQVGRGDPVKPAGRPDSSFDSTEKPTQDGPSGGGPPPAPAPPGNGGTPPGLATKTGGLPPGLAKKPAGLPPGQAKKHP